MKIGRVVPVAVPNVLPTTVQPVVYRSDTEARKSERDTGVPIHPHTVGFTRENSTFAKKRADASLDK
jgi:hypothetical protein